MPRIKSKLQLKYFISGDIDFDRSESCHERPYIRVYENIICVLASLN